MNVINTHLPWPQPSLKSNTPPPPRILAVRDTVDIDGAFFLPFIASTWVSSHRNASTECSLHWVSCGAETHQDVESTLSKYSCALKFGSSPLVQFVDVTQAVTSGEVDAGDPSYLKQVYSNISLHVSSAQTPSNSPILVVIDDASFLSTMFPKPDVLNFLNYLFALSHSSENLSVVFRVGADSALSIPSTSIVNVAGVRAGAVDCKHIGLGGVVGTSSDMDSSAFDVAKEESPSTPTPSTRGDFSTLGQIGSPSGFSRHADIVCDFTPLPSGFSREAYGNLKMHHVPSSRSPAAPPLSLNYQILDSGIIKAAKV